LSIADDVGATLRTVLTPEVARTPGRHGLDAELSWLAGFRTSRRVAPK